MALPKDFAALGAPCNEAVAVTPSDTTVLGASSGRGGALIYVGTGGDVVVDMGMTGTDVVFKNVPSGSFLPIIVVRVKAATTASNIVAIS